MTASAHDVAAELRRRLPRHGLMRIHKLLYYVQGWHLAWRREPAFAETIEAWANGPVVGEVWRVERHRPEDAPPPRPLPDSVIATVEYVVERYGHLSTDQLIEQTHREAPWHDASLEDARNPQLTHEALRRWFESDDDLLRRADEVARLRSMLPGRGLSLVPASPELDASIQLGLDTPGIRHARPR
jgi:uncharacterized phage-associated protein